MGDFQGKIGDSPIIDLDPRDRHKAARHVASMAYDATEAHDLLEMLDLMDALEDPDVA
jgi:hypothetical protein